MNASLKAICYSCFVRPTKCEWFALIWYKSNVLSYVHSRGVQRDGLIQPVKGRVAF